MKSHTTSILVGSHNPVKRKATIEAFTEMGLDDVIVHTPVYPIKTGVNDQPLTLKEAMEGTRTRLTHILNHEEKHDYYVAIESCVHKIQKQWFESACIGILLGRKGVQSIHFAYSPSFPLPDAISSLVERGKDLNDAMHVVAGIEKAGKNNGFCGWLTDNTIDRKAATVLGIRIALYGLQKQTKIDATNNA